MFGGIFTGLSGMQAFSNGLRQVSKNITNLNTTGFKGSSAAFNNLYNSGASGLRFDGNTGLNGGGVELSVSQLDLGAGELRQTGRDLDLAVDGNGFIVLERGGEFFYTRTGSFEVQDNGEIVLAGTDFRLTHIDDSGRAVALSIEGNRASSPEATTTVSFSGNLSSTSDSFSLSNLSIFDLSGEAQNWEVGFVRPDDAAAGEWTVTVTDGNGDVIGEQLLRFDNGVVSSQTQALVFTDAETGQAVELDFSENVTSFSSGDVSTLQVTESDGFGLGQLTTLTVSENGQLEAGYSNGETTELGAVSLALFADPQKLEQINGSMFVFDGIKGRELVSSQDERVGRVVSGRLEASNVDLSQQFGDLILVQRGFQASSQIVSISNDMIQQLFGIRGQG
jgi:flagellar hook protein FlgE